MSPVDGLRQVTGPVATGGGLAIRWPRLRALRRDRAAMAGLIIVAALALAALFAPVLAPRDPNAVDIAQRFRPPSHAFPLGTDELGRDILSRLLVGARLSIGSAVVAGAAISAIGLVLGLLAGYLGGPVDALVSRVVDGLLAFPSFLLALALTGVVGPGLVQVTAAVVAVGWVGTARVVRAAALGARDSGYVEASRALGAGRMHVLRRHLLPDVGGLAAVLTTLELSGILMAISALSFLGLGVRPPTAEWGAMLSSASSYVRRAPYMMVPPGAAIFVLALGFNLLGDGLRDALDPQATHLGRAQLGR